jgi:hypothetical protein
VRSGNEVYRLDSDAGTFFLKIPVKDLEAWPDPLDGAAAKVTRERAACQCLRDHGLPAPEAVSYDTDRDNPIGRPYLLTRCLVGTAFTTVVPTQARQHWRSPLEAVGVFLAAVHAIEFEFPGYLATRGGPVGPLSPEAPRASDAVDVAGAGASPRASHSAEVAEAEAMNDLACGRPFLDPEVADGLDARFRRIASSIAGEYWPPRFVIGGFHPNHPFLAPVAGGWTVSGCVDLEVASGGSVFEDLTTFAVGMMARFEADIPWWEPLFAAYGSEPRLERFRTALLSVWTYCFFDPAQPYMLENTYRALLAADSWPTLFNAHRPRAE